jgi:sarcosine oxidase subunit delta
MKIMTCPLNGPRNISEFVCAGEVKPLPAPDAAPEIWARHTYIEANTAGVVFEWWLHAPSAYWFIAERDTRTDRIVRTMSVDAFNALGKAAP